MPTPSLMAVTLARLNENRRTGAHAGWLAAVRTGLTPHAETPAIAQTAAFTHHLGDRAARGARAAAAIRALHKDVTHSDRLTLGGSLRMIATKTGSDQIAQQVAALPSLTTDNAAIILAQIVGRAAAAGVPVNFHALADTLTWWGTGATQTSKRTRNRVVLDFHRYVDVPAAPLTRNPAA